MPQQPEQRNELLEQACLALLSQHPDGISEFQLLKSLRDEEYRLFPKLEPDDHLGLFQSHFLLFHTLYRLRDRLHAEQRAVLRISALLIELCDYQAGEAVLCEADPLRDYYIDLTNLDVIGEADVVALLADFWRRMQLGEPQQLAIALSVLELDEAADFEQVKRQYRRLVMRHHPDRGGDTAKMHSLNEALDVLRTHYRR
ncbi:MAG: DNA-J related domain-containing protein [Pseudomonadota bacterium]